MHYFTRKQTVSFAIAFTSQSVTAMMIYVVPSLAPILKEFLKVKTAEIGTLIGVSWVGVCTTSVLFGVYGDRIGIRKVLLGAHAIQAVSLVVAFFATDYFEILAAFLGVGIGYSAVTPLTSKLIIDSFPAEQRASVMGFKQTGVVVGATLAGLFLPTIGILYGLPLTFLICALFVMASAVVLLLYKEDSVSYSETRNRPSFASLIEALGNRHIISLGFMGILFAAVQAVTLGYTTLYLQYSVSFSPITAGYLLSLASLMGVISRPFFGFINDKLLRGNAVETLFIIAVISAIALVAVSRLNEAFPFWGILVTMAVLGFGALGWNAVFLSFAGEMSPRGSEGTGTSTAFSIAMSGQVIGAPLFGVIADSSFGYVGSYEIYSVGIFLSGLVFLILFRNLSNHSGTEI